MGAYDRMRNAAILVVNFRGVATETIKNIVLAGIGKLIVWDREDVAAEDLGAGFFFRDEDVGKKVCSYFSCVLYGKRGWVELPPCPVFASLLLLLLPLSLRSLLTAVSYCSAWMRLKLVSRV